MRARIDELRTGSARSAVVLSVEIYPGAPPCPSPGHHWSETAFCWIRDIRSGDITSRSSGGCCRTESPPRLPSCWGRCSSLRGCAGVISIGTGSPGRYCSVGGAGYNPLAGDKVAFRGRRIPRELGKPVLLDAPLQIKHIAFAGLMVRFIKWGNRFRLPACLRSYELFR